MCLCKRLSCCAQTNRVFLNVVVRITVSKSLNNRTMFVLKNMNLESVLCKLSIFLFAMALKCSKIDAFGEMCKHNIWDWISFSGESCIDVDMVFVCQGHTLPTALLFTKYIQQNIWLSKKSHFLSNISKKKKHQLGIKSPKIFHSYKPKQSGESKWLIMVQRCHPKDQYELKWTYQCIE